jgi:hypothetical protein
MKRINRQPRAIIELTQAASSFRKKLITQAQGTPASKKMVPNNLNMRGRTGHMLSQVNCSESLRLQRFYIAGKYR